MLVLKTLTEIFSNIYEVNVVLKLITIILLGVWFLLVILGKGGFIHLILLVGISILFILLTKEYRRTLTE
jgi:phosphoglycerol transferase MdoB-like AlkP superfamily enzyme